MASANSTCSIDGCERKVSARGWCATHYGRWRTTGTTERLCLTCGADMDGYPAKAKYCSDKCKVCTVDGCENPVQSRKLCSAHYRQMRIHGTTEKKVCETCGGDLGDRPGQKRYCCPDCRPRCIVDGCDEPYYDGEGYCSKHGTMMRKHGRPTGMYEWAPKADTYECQACGTTYKAGAGWNRKFCSGRCQQLWRTYGGDIPSLDFDCAMCGKHITRDRWSEKYQRGDKKLCDRCKRSKHKRHHSSVGYLAKRDGTDCGICGEPVDMNLRHPAPMSPSVDHIMPVALGGGSDEENLQLSHLICNLTKQARADYRPA